MVTYREQLHKEMLKLAADPNVRFVGYNTKCGPQMNGTLKGCEASCIEMPVAENLMCGVAMGLALKGFLPVLCFERMDFTLACADALINHIGGLQHYGLVLPIIIRVCIGHDVPLDPGFQHKRDYQDFFMTHSEFLVWWVNNPSDIEKYYTDAHNTKMPVMIIERKELYDSKT